MSLRVAQQFADTENSAAPGWGAAGGRVVDAVSARETKTARELNALVGYSATHTDATKSRHRRGRGPTIRPRHPR
jgi:hypothetical protein